MPTYTRQQLDAHRNSQRRGYTRTTWASAVLQRLGVPETPGALQAMVGWERAEGGHWNNSARYNPLNTTQREPGYQTFQSVGQGSAPIGIYNSWDQGLKATVETLRNGRYNGIISALKSGDAAAVANAIGQTPWGTSGGLVRRSILGTPAPKVGAGAPPSAATPKTSTYGVAPKLTPGSTTTDTRGAVTAALLDPRKKMSLASRLLESIQSGKFTTTTAPVVTPGVTGTVGTPGKYNVTPATPGDLTSRANAIDAKHLPYLWGGGHAGKVDPYHATPLDCSGAVSAVLGINPRVAAQFKTWGKAGRDPSGKLTIYAKDTHVLAEINGHFWGTSAANPGGGAGWIPRSQISAAYLAGFTARHA